MSDKDTVVVVGDGSNDLKPDASKPKDSADEFVTRKAYEGMQKDMHKYKTRDKDSQAIITEQASKLKALEEQKLVEEKRWEELYKKERDEKIALEHSSHEASEKFNQAVKMSQLKSTLGGNVKDAYLQFADLNSIELKDDGTVDPDSVHRVANEFRQSYPELVPTNDKAKITNTGTDLFGKPQTEKTLQDMSYAEKAELLRQKQEERKNRS